MKKLLVITALTLASASAFATKARLSSLSVSRHLTDVQTIFINPADLSLLGSWATFEAGTTNTSTTNPAPQAEAGFARAMGDTRWGFYLGHTDTATALRTQSAVAYLNEENPINLFYSAKMADTTWGLGLNYSNSDQKTAGKQSTMGLTGGMRMGPWEASLGLGITDTAEVGVNKWTGKMAATLDGGYTMDAWYFYGRYAMSGGKSEASSVATHDINNSTVKVGMTNSTKVDGGEFFWGAAYQMVNVEDKTPNNKTETSNLPVVIGIEADAASWLVLRGSVTQTVLLNSKKTTTAGTAGDTATAANDTTVAAGAGIKFNKFMLDGTLSATNAATAGQINGNSLLANAGLTYSF